MKQTLTLKISVPIEFTHKKKCVVAGCPPLDVFSQGDTEEAAKENIIEALQLFFETCIEMGTLESVLKECGFKPAKVAPRKKKFENIVDIPLPFICAGKNNELKCHA